MKAQSHGSNPTPQDGASPGHGCQVQQTPQQTWPGAPPPQTYRWSPWSAGAPPPQTHGWSPWSGGAPQHPAGWPQQGWPGEGSSQGHGDVGSQPDQWYGHVMLVMDMLGGFVNFVYAEL